VGHDTILQHEFPICFTMSSSFKLNFIWPSIKKKKQLACFSIIKKKIKIKKK